MCEAQTKGVAPAWLGMGDGSARPRGKGSEEKGREITAFADSLAK